MRSDQVGFLTRVICFIFPNGLDLCRAETFREIKVRVDEHLRRPSVDGYKSIDGSEVIVASFGLKP